MGEFISGSYDLALSKLSASSIVSCHSQIIRRKLHLRNFYRKRKEWPLSLWMIYLKHTILIEVNQSQGHYLWPSRNTWPTAKESYRNIGSSRHWKYIIGLYLRVLY